jgi:hypothetical protein
MSETPFNTIEAADITPDLIRSQLPATGIVEVRDRGKLLGGFLSPRELAHYRQFVDYEVEVFEAGRFPDEIVTAIEQSRGKFGLGVD